MYVTLISLILIFFLEHSYNQGKLKLSTNFALEIKQHTPENNV
jgi:hypothetical protein